MDGELIPGDEHQVAAHIREVLRVGKYDRVAVSFPQFERVDGINVEAAPIGEAGFDVLREIPRDWLGSLGCMLWGVEEAAGDVPDGQVREHWLYPSEWYDSIPDGYEVVAINGRREVFQKGVTLNERRIGILPYGFTRVVARPNSDH